MSLAATFVPASEINRFNSGMQDPQLVPELKRFYVIVPKHIVLTPPVPQTQEASIEDANVMVFDILP